MFGFGLGCVPQRGRSAAGAADARGRYTGGAAQSGHLPSEEEYAFPKRTIRRVVPIRFALRRPHGPHRLFS